jgi:hypothetical protein
MIIRPMQSLDIEKPKGDPNLMGKVADQVSQIVGSDGFFVKDRKYSRQAEYRFIWNVGHDVDGCLDLPCPDARQFCEPLA